MFQREHSTDLTAAHGRQQRGESRTLDHPAAGLALIVVDYFHTPEAEIASPLGEVVLSLASLVMMPYLMVSRLPHVNIRGPVEMLAGDLIVHLDRSPVSQE